MRRRALAVLAALMVGGSGMLWAIDLNNLFNPSRRKFSKGKQPVATAAVRGLDEPGEAGDTTARDDASVEWMEARVPAEKELSAFLKDGGLGALP